ncbi:hypothetical protein [Haloferax gibbonsii]|uniref:Uncharacterized protein n=1 Tax=Haloferax gibbonsii TaxID=35746 RepID=A0A0K1J036_HALGI|nr:hypothetical protein [Haloferax gibbonsii]AKU09903.1 hypothetical protein ABY42_18980 [Haloferax gibbonsii]
MSPRERRVKLALKWHYLENLDVSEIRDRFEEQGIGDYTNSTIRDYLDEMPEEEILRQIEEKHTNIQLQSAERYERLYQAARRDLKELAVEDKPIRRVIPKMEYVDTDRETPMPYPAWEFVEPGDDDRPEWATKRDVIVRFLNDEQTQVMPGNPFPVRSIDGSATYTTDVVGLRRDQPDLQKRQLVRREMADYQDQKNEVLGGPEELNITHDGEVSHDIGLDEATQEIIEDLGEDMKV